MATYVYASSQGQRTHSARTKIYFNHSFTKLFVVYKDKLSGHILYINMVRCMCHDLFRMSVICQVQIPVISDVSLHLLCFPQPAKSAETHCPSHIGCLAATVVFPLENSSQLCSSCPLHVLVKIDSARQDFRNRKI